MRKLADHIRLAHKDVEEVRVSSDKITKRFNRIEKVELSNAPVSSEDQELADPIPTMVLTDPSGSTRNDL
jgi:DNA recombination protein RmuC